MRGDRETRVSRDILFFCRKSSLGPERESPAIGDAGVKAGRIYTQRALSIFFPLRVCVCVNVPPSFPHANKEPARKREEGGGAVCRAYRQRVIGASGFSFLEEAQIGLKTRPGLVAIIERR